MKKKSVYEVRVFDTRDVSEAECAPIFGLSVAVVLTSVVSYCTALCWEGIQLFSRPGTTVLAVVLFFLNLCRQMIVI